MTENQGKTKRCPECKRLVGAAMMRPLSRTRQGGGLRYACPDCFARIMALRKMVKRAQ